VNPAPTKVDLLNLPPEELSLIVRDLGQPDYRARQLFSWLHRGAQFAEMTDLSRSLRERLAKIAAAGTLELAAEETAADGATKFGFRTNDGHLIETVFIPYSRRNTVCVSSQIGCAFRCRFCATGKQGLTRDLTAGEIVEQVVRAQRASQPNRISNVVFMGMGEPLANYDSVLRAVRLINSPLGLAIGARHLAISTCGLPDQIRRLAGEGLQVALAISLHAATNDVRSQLVPVNQTHPIAEVMAAARDYASRTGRKVALQYVVVPGLNDTQAQARRLVGLMKGLPCMVNLIPQNPSEGAGKAEALAAYRFARLLKDKGLPVAVRKSRGAEVFGACGQLRSRTDLQEQRSAPHTREQGAPS